MCMVELNIGMKKLIFHLYSVEREIDESVEYFGLEDRKVFCK